MLGRQDSVSVRDLIINQVRIVIVIQVGKLTLFTVEQLLVRCVLNMEC